MINHKYVDILKPFVVNAKKHFRALSLPSLKISVQMGIPVCVSGGAEAEKGAGWRPFALGRRLSGPRQGEEALTQREPEAGMEGQNSSRVRSESTKGRPSWSASGMEDHLQGVLTWLGVPELKQGEPSVIPSGLVWDIGDQVGWRRPTWWRASEPK